MKNIRIVGHCVPLTNSLGQNMVCRILIVILLLSTMVACVPPDSMLVNRSIKSVDIGTKSTINSLSETDEKVDKISSEVLEIMTKQNFKLSYQSNSFGLLPFTGHTVNMSFSYNKNDHIYFNLTVSKHQFSASFKEVELKTKIKSV